MAIQHPWRGIHLLPKPIWVLFWTTLVNRSGMMALPYLVLYLTKELHYTAEDAAAMIVVYGIGAFLTGPVAGKISDRIGAHRIMILSLVATGLVLVTIPLAHEFWAVACLTVLWAVVSEAFRPASLAVVTNLVSVDQRKLAFAVNRLAINIGMSIGPAVGGFIALHSYPMLFYVNGIFSVLASLVMMFSRWPEAHSAHAAAALHREAESEMHPWQNLSFMYFLIPLLLIMLIFFQIDATVALYLVRDMAYPESHFGLLFSVNTVLIIFFEVWINIRMSHWKHRHALSLGALLIAIGFGLMAFSGHIGYIAFTVAVWTFGEMIIFPGSAAYVSDIAPASRRGEYMGYYQMTFSLGLIIGPWLGVLLYEATDAPTLWLTTLGVGIVATGMLRLVKEPPTVTMKVLSEAKPGGTDNP